ncbi:Phospho-N-acetylmuramoyl-pentapeptide-transferase [Chlamydiales bacterium SCGC AG-110-P3]|nr:Phospho-N-acetylmuramoyl-pentapeptide-transferase [Chlamydiales bacterium SCGC AG-110-P3]
MIPYISISTSLSTLSEGMDVNNSGVQYRAYICLYVSYVLHPTLNQGLLGYTRVSIMRRMILIILNILISFDLKVPAVFGYTSTRMVLAAITTLLISIGFGPRFIKKLYELKIGQTIRMEECPLLGRLHEKKKDTPTMGGVLILTSMVLSLLLWMDLTHPFTICLLLTTLVLGGLGGCDDYMKLRYRNTEGIRARTKLAWQVGFSSLLALYLLSPGIGILAPCGEWLASTTVKDFVSAGDGNAVTVTDYAVRYYLPFVKEPVFVLSGIGMVFGLLMTSFVVTGASNAVNLTDGLDGLAAGALVLVAASLALIAFVSNNVQIAEYLNILYIEGSGEVAIYLSALSGACLGFLWYNGYPAQVFMGDTGSLALGGVIGVAAVLLRREALLAVIGGIFVAEAVSVILQVVSYRLRNKKRIFLCAPLHHHFEYKGWPEMKVVLRFWIIGLLLAVIGVASLKFQ